MRPRTVLLLVAMALMVTATPSVVSASHETSDDRPTTTLEGFRAAVDPWIDPWIEISGTSIADDHAPWLAISLYELLLAVRPEPCYLDTYAAYWAVAADLRAFGQASTRERSVAAKEVVLDDIDRAGDLAERDARECSTRLPTAQAEEPADTSGTDLAE